MLQQLQQVQQSKIAMTPQPLASMATPAPAKAKPVTEEEDEEMEDASDDQEFDEDDEEMLEEDDDFVPGSRPKSARKPRRTESPAPHINVQTPAPSQPQPRPPAPIQATPNHMLAAATPNLQASTAAAIQQQIANRQRQMLAQGTPMHGPPGATPNAAIYKQLMAQQMMRAMSQNATPATTILIRPPQPPPEPRKEEFRIEEYEDYEYTFECCWINESGDNCSESFETDEALQEHVRSDHIPEEQARYLCQWRGCKALHKQFPVVNGDGDVAMSDDDQLGVIHRDQMLNHLKLHFPLRTKKVVIKTREIKVEEEKPTLKKSGSFFDDEANLAGIPLTAILILRNMAKAAYRNSERGEEIRGLFVECEGDLAVLMSTEPKFSKFIAQTLAEMDGGEDEEEL